MMEEFGITLALYFIVTFDNFNFSLQKREAIKDKYKDRIKEKLQNKGKGDKVSVQTLNLAQEFFNVILNVMQSLSLRINVQAYKCWTDDYGFEYTTLFHFEILCLV